MASCAENHHDILQQRKRKDMCDEEEIERSTWAGGTFVCGASAQASRQGGRGVVKCVDGFDLALTLNRTGKNTARLCVIYEREAGFSVCIFDKELRDLARCSRSSECVQLRISVFQG